MSNKLISKISGFFIISALLFSGNISAQDNEISAIDLRKYALLNEVIDLMKKDLSAEVNSMIKSQDGMTGQRYKVLAKTKGDQTKLTEIEAKEFEIQFLTLVAKLKTVRTNAIKLVNQELATKMIGNRGKTYKSIKSALKSDEAMKAQYDEIVAVIKK